MTIGQPLTLDDPQVQRVKQRFEEVQGYKHGKKLTLSFEELFDYFKIECNTQRALAIQQGVSRECVRQLYDRYFLSLFKKTGQKRQKICSLRKSHVQKEEVKKILPKNDSVQTIAQKAQSLGISVESVPYKNKPNYNHWVTKTKELIVGNKRCVVYSTHHIHRPNPNYADEYVHFSLSEQKIKICDIVIFYVDIDGYPERIILVPATRLLEKISLQKRKQISIPMIEKAKSKPRKVTNWLKYENRWDLLSESTPASL